MVRKATYDENLYMQNDNISAMDAKLKKNTTQMMQMKEEFEILKKQVITTDKLEKIEKKLEEDFSNIFV